MDTINIRGKAIRWDELNRELERLGVEPTDASGAEFALGLLHTAASDEQIEILKDLGLELLTPRENVAFAARFRGGDLNLIGALPFVAWVSVFPEELMALFGLTREELVGMSGEDRRSDEAEASPDLGSMEASPA